MAARAVTLGLRARTDRWMVLGSLACGPGSSGAGTGQAAALNWTGDPPRNACTTACLRPHAELWKPVLLRAAAALVFGAVTVFWAAPSVAGMGWAGGLYLLATGLSCCGAVPLTGFRPRRRRRQAPFRRGAALTGAGVAVPVPQRTWSSA